MDRVAAPKSHDFGYIDQRKQGWLVPNCFHDYKFTGCLVPGYPDLNPWQDDFWDLFWRIYARLRTEGLVRDARSQPDPPGS